MSIGLSLQIHLPGCSSLKEKRSRIKPVLARLHREYNVADRRNGFAGCLADTVIACVTISSDPAQTQRLLQQVGEFTERTWPDAWNCSEEHI
jgi:uncharacterized protein